MNGDGGAGDREQLEGYAEFEALHAAALQAAGLPRIYWKSLHRKIRDEVFDAGEVFGIVQIHSDSDSDSAPGIIGSKVVVTRASGLQTDDPDR
ncbi:tubulin--tyrosine ligase-like protein 12 [Boleophthalmus pectinirostris]|uniref:tubulin--tyrosine ligase-like protein 12 n=1 Tax=Boleophthalmus pectinirostris TaxID=150288 RepID=UPI00242EEFE2|nr:tubulin--tyrosine ligase-like protein 12 [Boleophthalmus pectinirostris]